jgi:hypothetical protein
VRRNLDWGATLFFCLSLSSGSINAQVRYSTVALSGAAAPGLPGATYFAPSDSDFVLDDLGRVGFLASLAGPGITTANDDAVYFGTPGSAQLLAREGSPAPGGGGGNFGFGNLTNAPFDNLSTSGPGRLAFDAYFRRPGQPLGELAHGIYTTTGGPIEPVALSGQPVPGGGAYGMPHGPHPGSGGHMGFADGDTLYTGPLGSPQVLAKGGGSTPFPGATYSTFFGWPTYTGTLDASGASAFVAEFIGPQVNPTNNRGVFYGTPGNVITVARSGEVAPGTGGGVFAGNDDSDYPVFYANLSNGGGLAFTAPLVDGRHVLYGGTPSSPKFIAKSGDAIPGLAGTIGYVYEAEASDNGRVVTSIEIQRGPGDSTYGLFVSRAGGGEGLTPVALEGEQVPGLASGVVYGSRLNTAWLDARVPQHPQLGPLVAFDAMLAGTGVTEANDVALFLASFDGDPILLVREGDVLTVAPGDDRTIGSFWGITSPNAAGQVAFHAFFTDGSHGTFVASVPEPGSLGTAGGLAALLRRRRKRSFILGKRP